MDSGPWDDFAKAAPADDGPWTDFQTKAPPPVGGTPGFDAWLAQTSGGRFLDAVGQGAKNNWGAEPLGIAPETEDFLKKAGLFDEYANGQKNLVKQFNEAIIRPAALLGETAIRSLGAGFGGFQAGLHFIGEEVAKKNEAAGRPEVAAESRAAYEFAAVLPEVMGAGFKQLAGIPHAFVHPDIAKARDLGVIGEGEAGYAGTAERKPLDPDLAAQALRSEEPAAKPAEADVTTAAPEPSTPAPDIHDVARQIAPDVFGEYDDLSTRRDTFGRWMQELRDGAREKAAAPFEAEITDLTARLEDTTPRLAKKYQARLDDLTTQRDAAVADALRADNPDMARVRQAYQEADFRMRDLAPDVSAAYRDAEARIGPTEEPVAEPVPAVRPTEEQAPVSETPTEAPVAEGEPSVSPAAPGTAEPQLTVDEGTAKSAEPKSAATEPAPEAPTEQPAAQPKYVAEIANDVTKKLTAAGRPEEEARAAAQVIASYYETRAARFNSERGTAADLYNAEAPEIRSGQTRARAKEMAQRKAGSIRIEDGRKIITLFKDADASTFIHESGHQFLEDLLADAEHPLAPSDLKADAQTVLDWLGAKDGEPIKTRQHEKFARGFERYMMEGVAPSKALARVFAQFRDWLTRIYQTVKNLKAPINDDIRSVFDRMLSQKPERTVIAPERKGSFADIHEADAENTPPERAHPVAETIQAERDTLAPDILTPEEENARLADTLDEARSREAGSPQPHRNEPQAEPLAGENGAAQGAGAVGAGGSEAPANRAGTRGKPTEPPAGPNARFPDPESRLVDKAGNIRLDNLGTPEDINAALRQTAEENDDFRGARRNVVSDQEVLDFADAMGVDARQINLEKLREMSLKDGIPLAARIVSGRKMLIQSATEVRDFMARAADGTDADVLAYARAKERHLMIQETVSAITAEIGRAMRAFRKLGGDQGVADLGKFLKDNTGKTLFQLRQEAKLGKSLDTPQKVSKYLTDSVKPTFGNMILEYWINGLISGPATHTTYMVGNALLGLWRAVPETAAAALIGKARGLLGDEGPRVHAGEVAAQLKAAVTELPSALSAAGQSLKTGVTTLLPEEKPRALPLQPGTELVTPGKIANAHMTWRQLGADAFGTMRGMRDGFIAAADLVKNGGVEEAPLIGLQRSNLGSIPDIQVKGVTALPVGTVIRLPGRAIAAIHSFFRATNYSMAKAAEAYRGAAEEGLSGEQFKARVGELVTNPSEQMMERSRAVATDLTLMGQGGEFVRALTTMTNAKVNLPLLGDIRPLKFIDPFVHIGANIIDQAIIQRGPLGIFSEQIRNDLLGKNGRVAQDEAGARMLVGTALSITAGTLAMQGLVTPSGPTDPHEAAIWRLAGNQAHSVRVGDFLYDVHRLGPLGMQIGIAADLYDVIHAIGNEDASKVAGMLVHSISQNILDESFMRGPSDLLKALEESDRYGASYVRNFLSSFLPYSVGMAQIARAIDPYTRQTRSVMDSFLAKIPGESQKLLPRRDIFGEPMPSREVLGVPGFSAIYVSKINTDPVIRAFQDTHYFPGQPGRAIRGVELTDQQYDDYSRIAGRLAKVRLDAIVKGPGFSAMPANIQHDLIVSTVEHAREAARTTIMIQNPTIMQAAMDAKTEPLRTGELRPKGPVKQKEAQ